MITAKQSAKIIATAFDGIEQRPLPKKRTYKVGQRVRLPAIKSEGVEASWATVVTVPDQYGYMVVREEGMREDELADVEVSAKTGRILARIVNI
jgi:hypothetical protein